MQIRRLRIALGEDLHAQQVLGQGLGAATERFDVLE